MLPYILNIDGRGHEVKSTEDIIVTNDFFLFKSIPIEG